MSGRWSSMWLGKMSVVTFFLMYFECEYKFLYFLWEKKNEKRRQYPPWSRSTFSFKIKRIYTLLQSEYTVLL